MFLVCFENMTSSSGNGAGIDVSLHKGTILKRMLPKLKSSKYILVNRSSLGTFWYTLVQWTEESVQPVKWCSHINIYGPWIKCISLLCEMCNDTAVNSTIHISTDLSLLQVGPLKFKQIQILLWLMFLVLICLLPHHNGKWYCKTAAQICICDLLRK